MELLEANFIDESLPGVPSSKWVVQPVPYEPPAPPAPTVIVYAAAVKACPV